MSEKKDNDLRVVDFKKAKTEAEKIPDFFIEKLELLLVKAKEGKLKTLITHFHFDEEEETTPEEGGVVGGTLLWNYNHNATELVGVIEIIKQIALDNALGAE